MESLRAEQGQHAHALQAKDEFISALKEQNKELERKIPRHGIPLGARTAAAAAVKAQARASPYSNIN